MEYKNSRYEVRKYYTTYANTKEQEEKATDSQPED